MKIRFLLISALLLGTALAQVVPGSGGVGGTISGQIQTATGGAIKQGTLTFSLSQPSVLSGTASIATQQVACYTSAGGNIVGVPDPVALPLVTANTASGTLAAGTYYVKIYYYNASGNSASSPEFQIILSAQGTLNINPPTLQPASASGFGVAIATTSGAEVIQGTVTGWTQFQQSQPLLAGSNAPTTNTSSCNIYFSDQLIPTGTYYTVNLINSKGSQIAGFPQSWCTYGGAGGVINVSQGAPTGNCNTNGVFYPTPILASPPGGTQSVTGTLDVGTVGAGVINNTCVLDGLVNQTFAAALTCAGTSGVLEIPANSSSLLTGNTTIPSGVTLRVDGPAVLNLSGFTLTVNGPIVAPPVALFTNGTVVLGSLVNQAAVEWFGAVANWNGSSGTDNTNSIQACFSSLTVGQCVLSGGSYKISAALSITNSSVGLIGTGSTSGNSSAFSPIPPVSRIVSTCASCDILDVAGSNSSHNLGSNIFKSFNLDRSVLPSGTARGLSIINTYQVVVDYVTSQDSIQDFYFKADGSAGFGRIENCQATFGYNGITETSGVLYGFFVDSSGGAGNPSIRLRNNATSSNLGHSAGLVWSVYGLVGSGTLMADLHITHQEAFQVDYGIYLNSSGTGVGSATDIHLNDTINDTCFITCIYINGPTPGTGPQATVTVNGGWIFMSGTPAAPAIDIENMPNVKVVGETIYYPGASGGGIVSHNAQSTQVIGNSFFNGASAAVSFNGTLGGVIDGNLISGVAATSLISLVNSTSVTITSNTMLGSTATQGILLDSASHSIVGLETNSCNGGGIGTCLTDSGGNYESFIAHYCGTTTTCVSPQSIGLHVAMGSVALSGGAATVSSLNSTFTATSSMWCFASDSTTTSNLSGCKPASATSISVTGTGTDTISYIVIGN